MKKIFLFASFVFSLGSFSQKLTNSLSFQKGQKLEMITKGKSVISMEMMGQAMETKIEATITRLFDVEDVANGIATIEHKMKRMQLNVEAPMAGSQSFDSENEKDMKGEGGKAMEKALKNKYKMSVDAKGKITMVKADDDNPNKTEGNNQNDMMEGAMSQLASGMELPKAGELTDLSILPNKELSKGESWSDSSKGMKSSYVLTDITPTDILIDYTETGSTERAQEANGMEIKISTIDKTSGKIILDRKTGLLKEKTSTTDSEGTMEMMGQTVPMTTKSTKTVTVKSI
jgi:hypothetical protein